VRHPQNYQTQPHQLQVQVQIQEMLGQHTSEPV
jgi:hypothetical protein